jgi:hypothetical protein
MSWVLKETVEFYKCLRELEFKSPEECLRTLRCESPFVYSIVKSLISDSEFDDEKITSKGWLELQKNSLDQRFYQEMKERYGFSSFMAFPQLRSEAEEKGIIAIQFAKLTSFPIGLIETVKAYRRKVKKEGYSLTYGSSLHEEGPMPEEFFIDIEDPVFANDFNRKYVMSATNQKMWIDVRVLLPDKPLTREITDIVAERFKRVCRL